MLRVDDRRARIPTLALAGLLLLAAVLRLWGLDGQLWHDEISALNSIRRDPVLILTRWPGSSSHILYEFLAHWADRLFGGRPAGIRLPAALFGIAGVAVTVAFARRWLNVRATLFVAALLAVSYHHIFFSQNARGYTALITLSLATTHVFITLDRPGVRWPRVLAYATLAALTLFVNPLGLFVPAGHGVIVIGRFLWTRARGLSPPPLRAPLAGLVAAAIVTILLYLPFVPSMLRYLRMNVATPAEGPRLGIGLLLETFEGLAAGVGGIPGLIAAGIAGAVGSIVWIRSAPYALVLLVAPLLLQVVVLGSAGVGLHPRYFALALPTAFLVGGAGIERIVDAAVRILVKPVASRAAVTAVLLIVIAAASALPLIRYYRTPKQDYLGAIEVVNELARPGDAKVAIYIVHSVINKFYGGGFLHAESLPELQRIEASHERVVLVTTLERLLAAHDAALFAHIRSTYRVARVLPGSIGDGAMRIYERIQ